MWPNKLFQIKKYNLYKFICTLLIKEKTWGHDVDCHKGGIMVWLVGETPVGFESMVDEYG